jgi:hypothetical protein
MRILLVLTLLLPAGLLAGCSASLGVGQGTGFGTGVAGETAPRAGYRSDGSYVLTQEEQAFDCRQLGFAADRSIQQINAMPIQAQQQRDAPPSSVVHAVARLSGGGIPVVDEFDRERARLQAIGQLLGQKSCPRIDLDAKTKAAETTIGEFRSR